MAKLTKSKAREILHDKTAHGHPLTDKQKRFFAAKAFANIGVSLPNYNDSHVSFPSGFVGMGNSTKGFHHNGAWGGTMQYGGALSHNPALAKKDLNFQKWYKKNTVEGRKGLPYSDKGDYDYYSYFKDNGHILHAEGQHFFDTYKRPSHPTFSNESIYSTPENPGGSWEGENFQPKGNFQMGGNLPGVMGNMYARTGAPSNGKYAKKTKASAQSGTSLFPIESWKKQGITSADTLQRGTMYRMPFIDQKRLYNTPIPQGVHPNDMSYMTAAPGQENPNDLFRRKFISPRSFSSDTSYSGVKKTSHVNGMELENGGMVYYQHGLDFKTKGMQNGGNLFDTKALKARNTKRDSVRNALYEKYPHNYNKVNDAMLEYFQQEKPINDNMGQWNHPGKVTKIGSNHITMQGVPYPVLGVSDRGHTQLMHPGREYQYQGNSVTEYPIMAEGGQLKHLNQLTDFTNNNHMEQAKNGKWIQKAVNPKHKGYCTPMTKSTCTPKRKAFAETMKKHHGFHEDGGLISYAQNGYQGPNLSQYSTPAPNFGNPNPPQGMAYQPLNLGQQAPTTGYGNYQAPQFNLNNTASNIKVTGLDKMSVIGGVVKGIKMLKQEKIQARAAKQNAMVTGLVAQASQTRPEAVKRKYVRPEDMQVQPEQMFPTYGTGTDYLSGKNGLSIKGEIQNTYAPKSLYNDLGYEPLDDSNKVKQFQYGGFINSAAGAAGSALGSSIGGGNATTTPNGGAVIGGTVGGAIGSYFGPVGRWVGNFAGSAIGGALDRNGRTISKYGNQTDVNTRAIAFQEGTRGLQSQNTAFMEDGGMMSHTWQPQVITKFGEYSMKDLLKPDPKMNTLRSGGHLKQIEYTPVPESGLQTYALGGELKTHWGGKAETMSNNPYLPGGGDTVMFKGQSHDETDGHGNSGIGVSYGNSPVEVERGEPAVKLQDGGKGDNLVVFGNMTIPSYGTAELGGDKLSKNRKFKNYISDLSKLEAKQNKTVDKGSKLVADTDDNDSFDLLKMNSGKALIEGGNMKLKDIAKKKETAAMIQNAILESAEEHGIDSEALSRGKIKKAKMGAKIGYAQNGKSTPAANLFGDYFDKISDIINPVDTSKYIHEMNFSRIADNPNVLKKTGVTNPVPKGSEDFNKAFGNARKQGLKQFTWKGKSYGTELAKPSTKDKYVGIKDNFEIPNAPRELPIPSVGGQPSYTPITNQKGGPDEFVPGNKFRPNAFGQLWPYFRPTNQIPLDNNQLAGEYYALANNQVDPVNAQRYSPVLDQPYDISFQDQLNANQADFNAIQRQTGYNPAAQAVLAGQKYAANSGVLGAQFRANQAEKAGVYSKNRDILNDAQLKNISLLDQQYVRQSQAKSNTKAIAQSALSSISDKIAQNKLENRTLGVYENLYGYRYDDKGRAYNLNAPVDFQGMIENASGNPVQNNNATSFYPGYEGTYDAQGRLTGTRRINKDKTTSLAKLIKTGILGR